MKQLITFLLLIVVTSWGCNKDEFPDEFVVIGNWIEVTTLNDKTEIQFKRDNDLMLDLVNDTIRPYKYSLDKSDELKIFEVAEFPNGRYTMHRVTYNKRKEQMTIFGLYPDTTGVESETVFKRK
jgi:hypothetical protein